MTPIQKQALDVFIQQDGFARFKELFDRTHRCALGDYTKLKKEMQSLGVNIKIGTTYGTPHDVLYKKVKAPVPPMYSVKFAELSRLRFDVPEASAATKEGRITTAILYID